MKEKLCKIVLPIVALCLVITGIVLNFKMNNRYDKLLTTKSVNKENTSTVTTTTEPVEEEQEQKEEEVEVETVKEPEPAPTQKQEVVAETNSSSNDVIYSFLTHYGPDCAGCGGTTASGYNVRNTIYYNDSTYGQVRIVAMSKNYPLYSIIRLDNYKKGTITAIVLDRGGAITGNKIDLLVSSESEASNLGIQNNVKVEILRWGR